MSATLGCVVILASQYSQIQCSYQEAIQKPQLNTSAQFHF